MWVGSLLIVIGAGAAGRAVSFGVIVAAYGVILIGAGITAWIRRRPYRTEHRRR
jgi:hypothetical protein